MNTKKNDILKLIAIITMVIDHIGYVFFPQFGILRAIGRISFPIFAYQISVGFRFTRNLKVYYIRLGVFALVSQIPYMLIFPTGFNIFFNLMVAVLALDLYAKKRSIALVGLLAIVFLVENWINFGYGIYGIILSLIFYGFRDNKESLIKWYLISTLVYCLFYDRPIQFFAMLSVPIILYQWKFEVLLNKWWFYLFYPVHLIILFVISRIMM